MSKTETIDKMNKFRIHAIFSDHTEAYQKPFQPKAEDALEIRIRVGKNTITKIDLCTSEYQLEMTQTSEDDTFAFFSVTIPPDTQNRHFSYYFHLYYDDGTLFYTKYGVFDSYQSEGWFWIVKGYCVPNWAVGAVMYQIFPDRFCNGDKTNDVVTGEYAYLNKLVQNVPDWNTLPQANDTHCFYGGDLQGIINKLDYLDELGVEVLYLNPIFVSPSNHKYDVQDYDHIDPHFGKIVFEEGDALTNSDDNQNATLYKSRVVDDRNLNAGDALFEELVNKAHGKGIKIILDGVFNHCGGFHRWLNKEELYPDDGAFHDKNSPYRDFFYWENDEKYEGWWGYENHPKLNVEGSKKLQEELYRIARKWVSQPYNADGWRLDVAADLGKDEAFNHTFWQGFRDAVKEANPNALILAEHYGDATAWLQGDQWDSIMNYDAFMEPISWFFTGVSKHSDEQRDDLYQNANVFWGTMCYRMGNLPPQALAVSMNELSNHDHSRFLTRTNGKTGRLHTEGAEAANEGVSTAVMREAVMLQMTWVGAPTIYYGDEVGLCGWTDPDNRRSFPWGHEDREMLAFHQELIRIRKESRAFSFGSLKQLAGNRGIIGYGRFDEKDKYIVLFNNLDESVKLEISPWEIGVAMQSTLRLLIETFETGFSMDEKFYRVVEGVAIITLPPKSGMILKEVDYES